MAALAAASLRTGAPSILRAGVVGLCAQRTNSGVLLSSLWLRVLFHESGGHARLAAQHARPGERPILSGITLNPEGRPRDRDRTPAGGWRHPAGNRRLGGCRTRNRPSAARAARDAGPQ